MADETNRFNRVTAAQLASGVRLGLLHYSNGRWESAMNIFRGLAFIDPQNPYLHTLLGSALQQQGRVEEAIAEYTEALKLFPEDVSAMTNRGELHLKAGNIREAAADLKRAAQLDVTGKHPAANRARLLLNVMESALELVENEGIDALNNIK